MRCNSRFLFVTVPTVSDFSPDDLKQFHQSFGSKIWSEMFLLSYAIQMGHRGENIAELV